MTSFSEQDSKTIFDWKQVISRLGKYLIEGIMVAVAAFYIPRRGKAGKSILRIEEAILIGLTAAATFALLDIFSPSIGNTVRQGAGFGIGAGIVQWPMKLL
tara:strand:- start:196 stop:498 length:303 start_codon:yes stop_codon:yes gene_type:complete